MKQLIGKMRPTRPILAGIVLLAAAYAPANAANEGYATLRATVGANATVISSNGLSNAVAISVGVKLLTFTRNISTCTITASAMGGVPILVSASPSSPTTVTVRTFRPSGALVSRTFAVIVQCGP